MQRLRPLLQKLLLFPHGQEVPGARPKLQLIHRAEQEVGRTSLQRLITVAALLIDRDHHHRHLASAGKGPKGADEVGAIHVRHLEVGDHQIGGCLLQPGERRFRAGERLDPDPFLDRHRQARQDIAIGDPIIDDNHIEHGNRPKSKKSARGGGRSPNAFAGRRARHAYRTASMSIKFVENLTY